VRTGKKPTKEEARDFDGDRQVYRGVFEKLKIEAWKGLTFGRTEERPSRICLPSRHFERVFRVLHCHPSAGHFGIGAMQKKFRQKLFMPGSGSRIATEIVNCVQKQNFVSKDQYVYHRTLEPKPFSRIYVDIVGPLPSDSYGDRAVSHLVTMMDGFTKWAEAIPVSDTSAERVAQTVFNHWVSRYGVPDQIHSDQGTQFTSDLFKKLMEMLGILHTTTPAYNPRSNKVERLPQVLGDILRSDQTGPTEKWVANLPLALFAYRTTISNVTCVTPFQAIFGVNSKVPLDIVFLDPGLPVEIICMPPCVRNLQEQLQNIYQFVRKSQGAAVQRATAYQSGKVKNPTSGGRRCSILFFTPIDTEEGSAHIAEVCPVVDRTLSNDQEQTECLKTIRPIRDWAKNERKIVTTIDKIKVINNQIPEERLYPAVKIVLGEVEEELEDFGEYIRGAAGEPEEGNIPVYLPVQDAVITDWPRGPGGSGSGVDARGSAAFPVPHSVAPKAAPQGAHAETPEKGPFRKKQGGETPSPFGSMLSLKTSEFGGSMRSPSDRGSEGDTEMGEEIRDRNPPTCLTSFQGQRNPPTCLTVF